MTNDVSDLLKEGIDRLAASANTNANTDAKAPAASTTAAGARPSPARLPLVPPP